jgi:DNA-binding protein
MSITPQEPASEVKKDTRPKNEINVSTNRVANFYVFLSKMRLKESETVELHALGNAVATAVMAAENLVRNKYAVIQRIKTKTIEVDGRKGPLKKAKLVVTLQKGKHFDEAMENFEKMRADQAEKKAAE